MKTKRFRRLRDRLVVVDGWARSACRTCARAAVILPKGLVIDGLNDSKKLTDKKRP